MSDRNQQTVSFMLVKALYSKAVAEIEDNRARLHLYAQNAVGIGEHPQITEEMRKFVDAIAQAQDCISVLQKEFPKIFTDVPRQ